jgi:glucokinase
MVLALFKKDDRIVLTLDAGGTNLVFNAIKNGKQITEDFSLPTQADDLDKCLSNIVSGFEHIIKKCPQKPCAISFAFPGPADYKNGIIGGYLPNFPTFRQGVALGPYLKEKFNIPVFINNDGDLFAYGEATNGALPLINKNLKKAGIPKTYKNLFGITLGTGVGGGLVRNGELFFGDNNAGAEIWTIRNRCRPHTFCEENISIRGLQKSYALYSGDGAFFTPKDIYDIACGEIAGDKIAAQKAFEDFGQALGDLIANILTIVDGIVVIGGGVAAAAKVFMPHVMKELTMPMPTFDESSKVPRLESTVYNLTDPKSAKEFYNASDGFINIPYSAKEVFYNRHKKTAVTISTLGASLAIALGAYSFALNELDKMSN